MEKFLKYNITTKKQNSNLATYTISLLNKGFGITLGNAIRRTMLSSIPGSAPFAIKIPKVTHEYQAIVGIKEDVTQIILNIKKIVIEIDSSIISDESLNEMKIESWPTLKINFKGSGIVKASDIVAPAGFKIVNPDLYICDVTGKDGFEAEIYATKGIGFKSFLENKENIETLSIIPIDSNFSPIVHANFKVEELKLAKHKVGDELTIEVGTNGSITPNNALALAGKILLDHFTAIANIDSNVIGSSFIQEKTLESTAKTLSTSIDELNLSVRSYNCLKRTGIQTIQDLISYSKEDIKNIKNMGLKSYKEIFKVVEQKGYSFAG